MHTIGNTEYPRAALRVSEACQTLSISRSKLYEEISAGRLRVLKSGRRTLVPTAEIVAWLNGLKAKAA
jgi:excisionase family DNA binding protein